VKAAHAVDAVAAMTAALAPKKVLTPMVQPHQTRPAMQKAALMPTLLKALTAARPANAVHVTATAVTVASVVDAVSAANAAMRRPNPAQPKGKKARKLSTWCALLTLPSPQQRLHRW
jgi:hypothetical protein